MQIIDRYLGNFAAVFSFKEDAVVVSMTKTAENFLSEYDGMLTEKKA